MGESGLFDSTQGGRGMGESSTRDLSRRGAIPRYLIRLGSIPRRLCIVRDSKVSTNNQKQLTQAGCARETTLPWGARYQCNETPHPQSAGYFCAWNRRDLRPIEEE